MHALAVLRMHLGLTQSLLAKAAGVAQADVSEIENLKPYGYMEKYLKLSRYLEIPVDVLLKDDCSLVPESFFQSHPPRPHLPMSGNQDLQLGREGEDFIFQREQERLREICPVLAELVLPCYKLQGASPGYDLLSFDEQGKPIFLEVKTSQRSTNYFRLTPHEMETAKRLTEQGEQYIICYISGWGTPEQEVQEILFQELSQTHQIVPAGFHCKPKPETKLVSGLAYFRHLRKLRQMELANLLDIRTYHLSLYETGQRAVPVQIYIKASEHLDVSIEDLLRTYPSEQHREVAHG